MKNQYKPFKLLLIFFIPFRILLSLYTLQEYYCTVNLVIYILWALYTIFLAQVIFKLTKQGLESCPKHKIYNLKFIVSHLFGLGLSFDYLLEAIKLKTQGSTIWFIGDLLFTTLIMYFTFSFWGNFLSKIVKNKEPH